jgi:hypothetical protein
MTAELDRARRLSSLSITAPQPQGPLEGDERVDGVDGWDSRAAALLAELGA